MTRAKLIAGLWVGVALIAAQPARAEEMPSAIGRISYDASLQPGAAICTGVLVASDLVLTAAHCVREAAESPENIRFEAGWLPETLQGGLVGRPTAQRTAVAVILVKGAASAGKAALLQDVALVVLDAPLPAEAFPPLPLAAADGGPFTLIGFDRSAPDRLPEAALCTSLERPPGLLALDCAVVSGNSGAPLMQKDGTGWRLVAVMVASARGGPVRSWAVLPPTPLRLRIAEPNAQTTE